MRGFVSRVNIDEALARLKPLVPAPPVESIPFDQALGRALAEDVSSPIDVPSFAKSAVDGYGVRAEETFGASSGSPLVLRLIGEVLPGRVSDRTLGPGEAIRIMTGGAIPRGVDAVVMAEYAREREASLVALTTEVTPGRHVVRVGEDIAAGDRLIRAGRLLRPADLGVLASVGRLKVPVYRRTRVAVATTGNELVAPEDFASAPPNSVVNSNGFLIEGLVRSYGAEPVRHGIIRDDPAEIGTLVRGFDGEILVTTGGTSVGNEDFLPVVVAQLGTMHVHGINIRPGSPSGFGVVGARLVFLLPGNPVAAAVGFDVLVRPALEWMRGQSGERHARTRRGRLTRKVASALNRVDFIRVALTPAGVEPLRGSGAGILSSLSRADGMVIVGKDLEGIDAGAEVEVILFDALTGP